jgi:uncharacterized iron-regulated membrane protein
MLADSPYRCGLLPFSLAMNSRPSLRRVLAFLHLWAGLILGVPLVVLGLTGSILVFEHELDRWTKPELYAASSGAKRSVAEIVAAARKAGPERLVPAMVGLPEEPGDPAIVRLVPPGRGGPGVQGAIQVFVDPGSLAVLGTREPTDSILRQIFLLHANLMVRGDRTGREIIGWLGVIMLGFGLTGLYLWWPRNGRWHQAFLIKRSSTSYRFNRDLHGAAGIWGLAVFVLVSFSGVYLAFPQTIGPAITTILPGEDLRARASQIRVPPATDKQPLSPDEALSIARERLPEAEARAISLPGRPDQPVRISMARSQAWAGAPPINVFLDPFTREILAVQDPRSFSLGELVLAYQHALHEGGGLGPVWRLLVFLSGFLPLVFAITGTMMWLKKRGQRAGQKLAAAMIRPTA